ncbi:leucine-rich repeat domain-containing protein [Cohnella cellulosilytica]|uniref:Leucine-rich repeat domain-containing protein n=1 Tax=Cohnella cellulosilytica TaxID=986710 RepID=A0ABW2FHP7_9BACL
MKCPYCKTELLLKENNVYFVEQTINHYYGTSPAPAPAPAAQPKGNAKALLIVPVVLLGLVLAYFFFLLQQPGRSDDNYARTPARTVPESEVLLFFLKDIFNKGTAMPTGEEIASIRYLAADYEDNEWRFTYSFDDPFTTEQPEMFDYTVADKLLNTQEIEQKDFEAFSGLAELNLMNEYEIGQGQSISFEHMHGLKSYTGAFNESFRLFADYFEDKAKIVKLSTQIRSNAELALLLDFPNLQALEITYVDESVTDYHLLSQLHLKSLSLTYINDLKWLSALTDLHSLAINYSEATDFSALYSLSQLQELKLSFVKNLKTLDFVPNMPTLQSLDIEMADIPNLEQLKGKKSLTKLRLSSVNKLRSVEPVNSLSSLTELSLSGYYGPETALTLPHLEKAELSGRFFSQLQAPALKSLIVYISGSDLNGAELLKHPQLERLDAREYGEFTDIQALDHLPNLRVLNLSETALLGETSELFRLRHVGTLSCRECRFQLGSADPLKNDTLENLTLSKVSFQVDEGEWLNDIDELMPYFAGLTGLRSFTVQDESLQSLAFMRNWRTIESLHLENNAISDVEPLKGLTHLRKLYLVGNPVQNKSILDARVLVY